VQNLDLVPTVLEALGLPHLEAGLEGRSVLPGGRDSAPLGGSVFASQGALRSFTDGRRKLIHDLRAGRFWLYDLEADPRELSDLVGAAPDALRPLRRELLTWLRQVEGEPSRTLDAAAEMEERLRALGYLQ
jgi:arylsulfatase A-like enzyme